MILSLLYEALMAQSSPAGRRLPAGLLGFE
jgi:hypothetical protein